MESLTECWIVDTWLFLDTVGGKEENGKVE